MQYGELPPDTLTAILVSCIEDRSKWEDPLKQFKNLLVQIHSNNPPVLPSPNENFTDDFVFSCMPRVVTKILDSPLTPDGPAVEFLEEVITTVAFFISNTGSFRGIQTLQLIFDKSGTFYIHNGRDENFQYSKHLTRLAEFFIKNQTQNIIINLLERINDSITIIDFYNITDVFNKIILFVEANKVFPDKEKTASVFIPPIGRFALDEEERKIDSTRILTILQNLMNFCRCSELAEIMNEIMFRFLEIDIAGIKISGVKIANILFTEYYTYSTQEEIEAAQSSIEVILSEITNFEGFKLLEPIFTTFANKDIFSDNLIDSVWNIVTNSPQSVLKNAIELFANVAVKVKNTAKIVSIATTQPINIDFVTEIAQRSQFRDSILKALFSLAENDKDLSSLEALIKISKTFDLSTFLPTILSNINCPELLKDHLILIDLILSKSPQKLEITGIFSSIVNNVSTFSEDDSIQVLKTSASILRKSVSKISPEVLKSIFDKFQSPRLQVSTIKEFFPRDFTLVDINNDNLPIIVQIVEFSTTKDELFEIISHLYLTGQIESIELKNSVYKCLWNILLNPQSESKRKIVSGILLTFNEYSDLCNQIKKFISSCLDELLANENKNAAIFISECLHFVNGFCTYDLLGIEPHRYLYPNDMCTINYSYDSDFNEVVVDEHLTVSELTAVISNAINKSPLAIALYFDGEPVPKDLVLNEMDDLQSIVFLARNTNDGRKISPFTIENHPISLFRNEKIENRLFELLKSPISKDIYDVLIQIPTLEIYSFKSTSQLDQNNSYHFLYDLHYLAKNINKFSDDEKNEIQNIAQTILISQFENLLPEARFLLSLLLKQENVSDDLVNNVLYSLCKEISSKNKKDQNYYLRTIKVVWVKVSNHKIDLNPDILYSFLFNENKEISELALSSPMILTQSFEKVYNLFEKCENKENFIEIFAKFEIPNEFNQKVFYVLYPFYNKFNETVLRIYSNLCDKWAEFPSNKISEVLIENFIKCTTSKIPKSNSAFDLIFSIMKRSPEVNDEILKSISETMPTLNEWNFKPTSISSSGFIGLQNLGATCYANSVIQLVYSVKPIRNFIISTNFADPSLIALKHLFTQMHYSKSSYLDMHQFAANWTGFDGCPIRPREQQDANEFLMLLFSRLESYDEFNSLVSGKLENKFVGDNYEKINTNTFNSLPLIVLGMNSIHESMEASKIPEIFDDYKVDDGRTLQVKSYNTITQLPPFLFIQLKRFDFSIETSERIKLNQKFAFDTTIDFKNDLKELNQETKYRLRGVVIHQGDANAGHYYTYLLSKKHNSWYCVNDTHINPVTEAEMKSEGYGKPNGVGGYLLLYERIDVDTTVPTIELKPDEQLMNEIHKQNHEIIIENTYYSNQFSKFASNFIEINEKSFEVAIKYYESTLSHSTLVQQFHQFSKKIIELISKKDQSKDEQSFLDYYVNHLAENISIIIEIMSSSASKEIKGSYSDVLKTIFSFIPTDSDIVLVISSLLDDWYTVSLQNWRDGFTFIKVLYDFSTIDEEHSQFLSGLEVDNGIINFVVNEFPPFLQSNSSSFSAERFMQLCDLTYAFKLFETLHTNIELILAPNFLQWCIGSSKHQESLIHCCYTLCPACIKQFDKYVDATGHPPSEFLVSELIKFQDFQIPTNWLKNYFSEPATQKYLLRALHEQFMKNFNLFPMFVANNSEAMCNFLFSPVIEVREETVEKLVILQEIGPVCEHLIPFIGMVVDLSKALYSNPDYKFTYLPLDCFVGLHFLGYIVSNVARVDTNKLIGFIPGIEKSFHELVEMKSTRDEHAISIAHISLILMNNNQLPMLTNQFVSDIEAIMVKMVSDHKQLPAMIRLLCSGLISYYQRPNNTLSSELLMPDNELKNHMFLILFTKEEINMTLPQTKMIKELDTTKVSVINLLQTCTQRYATSSRIIKFLYAELTKRINEIDKANKEKNVPANNNYCEVDMKSVYEILSQFHKDVLDSNMGLISDTLLKYFVGEIGEIRGQYDNEFITKSINFLQFLFDKKPNMLLSASKSKPKGMMWLFKMIAIDSINTQTKLVIISFITKLLPSVAASISYVYSDIVVADHFSAPEIDPFIAFLISEMLSFENSKDFDFFQSKVASELAALIEKAGAISEMSNSLGGLHRLSFKLNNLERIKCFILALAQKNVLVKLWGMKPEDVEYKGIFLITKFAVLSGFTSGYNDKLIDSVKLYQSMQYHGQLFEILNDQMKH